MLENTVGDRVKGLAAPLGTPELPGGASSTTGAFVDSCNRAIDKLLLLLPIAWLGGESVLLVKSMQTGEEVSIPVCGSDGARVSEDYRNDQKQWLQCMFCAFGYT